MIENLLSLVRQHAGDAIVNNGVIPNEPNEEAIGETGNSILQSLQSALGQGGMRNVMDMFSNGWADTNNPVVQQASGNLVEKLQDRFGLNLEQASGLAGSLVPNVMNGLAQKTADPNDNSFDLQSIFNQLTGGKTAGMDLQGILSRFKVLDKDGDGDTDLQDLQSLFAGSGSSMDRIKGLFN